MEVLSPPILDNATSVIGQVFLSYILPWYLDLDISSIASLYLVAYAFYQGSQYTGSWFYQLIL
jgi:hypothetical protein